MLPKWIMFTKRDTKPRWRRSQGGWAPLVVILGRFWPGLVGAEIVPFCPGEAQCEWKTRTLGRKRTSEIVISGPKTLLGG